MTPKEKLQEAIEEMCDVKTAMYLEKLLEKFIEENDSQQQKMKRQGLIVTIPELQDLIVNLSKELTDLDCILNCGYAKKEFQINIINKTPKCSDTWRLEDSETITNTNNKI